MPIIGITLALCCGPQPLAISHKRCESEPDDNRDAHFSQVAPVN